MIRGIEFQFSQEIPNVLYFILNELNIESYHWHVVKSQEEVWITGQNNDFFDKYDYDGNEFAEKIMLNHYIIFLKIQAYFTDGTFDNIQTYEEFLRSDCQILILVNDCEFVEIYCKDKDVLKRINSNAFGHGFRNVRLISDENDNRITLNVL